MTRLILVLLLAAGVGGASAADAEARKHGLRRAKVIKPKKTALAESAWAEDRCTQQARERRARAKARAKAKAKAKTQAAMREEVIDEDGPEPEIDRLVVSAPHAPVRAPGRWRIEAGAAAGGNAIGMRVARSEGGGGLGTGLSAAYGVSGAVRYRVSGGIHAGIGVDGVLSGPLGGGLQYRTTEAVVGTVPFRHHQVDARAELAYRGNIELAARAGYHYAHLDIQGNEVDMPITGEAIAGYLVGMSAALPVDRVVLSAALDVMPRGVQAPTVEVTGGMLYGTAASGAWATGGLAYRVTGRWLGTATYRYGRSTIALTDDAATPNTATRVDQSHTVMAGIGLSL
jgi:hypothetical protein